MKAARSTMTLGSSLSHLSGQNLSGWGEKYFGLRCKTYGETRIAVPSGIYLEHEVSAEVSVTLNNMRACHREFFRRFPELERAEGW